MVPAIRNWKDVGAKGSCKGLCVLECHPMISPEPGCRAVDAISQAAVDDIVATLNWASGAVAVEALRYAGHPCLRASRLEEEA